MDGETLLDDDYVKELRHILNLKINTKSRVAYDIFETINKEHSIKIKMEITHI